LTTTATLLQAVPLLCGILLSAPFVLELEQGTHRLAWTQSITRLRWVTLKVSVIVCAAVVAALLLTAAITWWRAPLDQLDGRFHPDAFDLEGTAPLAYALFAVALGLAIGTTIRRAIPAIGLSVVGYILVRLVVEEWARPHYMAPLVAAGESDNPGRSAWIYGSTIHDRLGHDVSFLSVLQACGKAIGSHIQVTASCFAGHGFVNVVVYQPGDRFWAFQAIETAIFCGLAAALIGLTVWWVRYRLV
jgi:hypothetical protein